MDTEPAEQPNKSAIVADEKSRLECEKIKAEIEVISRPFYKTSAFYVSMTPVLLGICGLIFTYASGWFDVQRTRIENQKTLLQFESEQLEAEAKNQRAHIGILETNLVRLTIEREHLTNQIVLLEKERNEMRSAKEYFESQAQKLAGSETNALKFFNELQAMQFERKSLTLELATIKASNAKLTESVNRQLSNQLRRDSIYTDAIRLSWVEKKPSQKQYEDFVYEVVMLGLVDRQIRPYSEYGIPNINSTTPESIPDAWKTDAELTNTPAKDIQ